MKIHKLSISRGVGITLNDAFIIWNNNLLKNYYGISLSLHTKDQISRAFSVQIFNHMIKTI